MNIANEQQLIVELLTKHSFRNLIIVSECVAIERNAIDRLIYYFKKRLKAEEIRNQIFILFGHQEKNNKEISIALDQTPLSGQITRTHYDSLLNT